MGYASFNFNNKKKSIPKNYYKKALKIIRKLNITQAESVVLMNLALLHSNSKQDSAKYYLDETIKIYKKENLIDKLYDLYINTANFYFINKKYPLAIKELQKADSILLNDYKIKSKKILYEKFSSVYNDAKDYKNAFKYLTITNKYTDSLNTLQNKKELLDLDKKYKTVEKEKEILRLEKNNLETEAKRIKNRNFLIGSLLFILLGGTIGVLSLKNSKRKRKLAEQEKEIQTQKNITILKEQELTIINAMVDGQEKERKRIAEDLHDNLGSVLATLKLHFENLKMNREKKKINQETLFDKTEGLIDEAYLKVRSIAHAKNAGVIANQGLLIAVQMMAEKISSADKIKIEVIDFGLNKRLDNSLEITIFRIIQELITNIIKHADAKNATINVSLYDKNLNIIIEDDGKGFDINKVNLKNGMGINSIKTRIEHLNGSFEIDSTIGKGSSIIIDLPVE
ncbi:MAG: sensor histidine kinase [Polaribacter sp.]|uniref:sensor histidine kinase n=1 Tax=Polaribacter sp. TaxID=1920175 RepID=UPI002F35EE09